MSNVSLTQAPSASVPPAPAYLLVHHAGRGVFAPRRLTAPIVTIGRVPGNDVVIDSPNISRRHAKLLITDLGVTAHDLDSHNGVFINGKKIRSAPVGPGDLLYVGDVCVRLERDNDVPFVDADVFVELDDADDQSARALAALLRATVIAADSAAQRWASSVLQCVRDLLDASVTALVDVRADGDLATIAAVPDHGDQPVAVLWPVVQRAVATREAVFADDLRSASILDDLPIDAPCAVVAIPMVLASNDEQPVHAVIYAARAVAGPDFHDGALDTLRSIAAVVGLRLQQERALTARPADAQPAAPDPRLVTLEEQLAVVRHTAQIAADRVRALEQELLQEKQQNSALGEETARALTAAKDERQQLQTALREAQGEMDALRARAATEDRELTAVREDSAPTSEERSEVAEAADESRARIAALEQEAAELRGLVEEQRRSGLPASAEAEALRNALRMSVPPALVEHVEGVASGLNPSTSMATRSIHAMHVGLSSFDAFCVQAAPGVVKATLDRFCAGVVAQAHAHGGRVEQVVGHGHLVVFSPDAAGAEAAVRCALGLTRAFPGDDGSPAVVAGVHHGSALMGFFGDAQATAYVEAGTPVVVARAASEHASLAILSGAPRGVVVSDTVAALLAGARGMRVTRLGPVWIAAVRAAVTLCVVEDDDEGEA